MIIDLAGAPYSSRDGSYGGMAGFKDGVVFEDTYWLIKYPKITTGFEGVAELSYTTSPLSEFIGSHIYSLLGFDTHVTELCFRKGKIAVACKDFCNDAQRLLEIRTLKNAANEELTTILETDFSSTGSEHEIDLDELLTHLRLNRNLKDIPGITDRFWDMVVIDIFINNNDRNNGNWGIIRDSQGDRLAPIFDNGASFNAKTPDSKLSALLLDIDKLRGSVLNGSTAYSRRGKKLSAGKMLTQDIQGLKDALIRNVPKILSTYSDILEFINTIPTAYTTPEGNSLHICSDIRRSFYIKSLQFCLDEMLLPAYKRVASEGGTNYFSRS